MNSHRSTVKTLAYVALNRTINFKCNVKGRCIFIKAFVDLVRNMKYIDLEGSCIRLVNIKDTKQ